MNLRRGLQSGTGVLADNAAGMYATETIYHDSDAAQIESLPDTQAHRDVDLLIVEADKAGRRRFHASCDACTERGIRPQATSNRTSFCRPRSTGSPATVSWT